MADCNDNYLDQYNAHLARFAHRAIRAFENFTSPIAGMFEEMAARKRRRKTILALAALPENILHDIGWPDLYERQFHEDKN
ncbi:DUF1127 domain-containing protein [Phyllobacterium leguminum]|uniref:Uncharacterized protein DUF1127 n=1 Tax=Phyllobacterium leguminum TaxID=314237 RepID=A0A318T553_9HYPH|nr:DUF1127 domain-containing protein [Phyllobacterium leguminum]PYE90070.1 uncharacterized protein DUF1127 [Phyllobacterium leguminum]